MMKKIKYLFLFLAIFATNSIFSQNNNQAKACLDKATSLVANQGGITAHFTLSLPGGAGSTSGTISIKGSKFVATTPQTTIWFNGTTQWTYMKATDEVNVSTPTEAQRLTMNPYALMTMYRQGYSLSMSNKSGAYSIHMKATNPKRNISEAYITVSKNYQLQNIKMKQGNKWTNISISRIQSKNLPDNIFTFNKKSHPSADVIDLR